MNRNGASPCPASSEGVVLLLVVGILLMVTALGVLIVSLQHAQRRIPLEALDSARSSLLARSGFERAMAEISNASIVSPYGGEDWDGDGIWDATGPERDSQVYRTAQLDARDCPLAYALRPSFPSIRREWFDGLTPAPDRIWIDGSRRGFSGRLRGTYLDGTLPGGERVRGDTYTLQVVDESAKINVNGGFLDDAAWDPDPPGNGVGWNRQLARILNTLGIAKEDVDGSGTLNTGEDWNGNGVLDPPPLPVAAFAYAPPGPPPGHPNLGEMILRNRPKDGYRSIEEMFSRLHSPSLGGTPVDFTPYLTVSSWVDRKVVRPNAARQTQHEPAPSDEKKARGELRLEEGGRAPVNLNAADPAVLYALFEGISAPSELVLGTSVPVPFSGPTTYRVSPTQSSLLVSRFVRTRKIPVPSWSQFSSFLQGCVDPLAGAPVLPALTGFPVRGSNGAVLLCGLHGPCDMILANFDPNTRLQGQVPDTCLGRWFDKSDLLDYSTEGSLHPTGAFTVRSLGRVVDTLGRTVASVRLDFTVRAYELLRHSSQADFLGGRAPDGSPTGCLSLSGAEGRTSGASASWRTWGGAPGQGVAVMTYPCPMQACLAGRQASFDGYVGLATTETSHDSAGSYGGTLTFLHHFDDGWNADIFHGAAGADGALKRAPAGTGGYPNLGTDCDGRLERTGVESVWPPSGAEPGTLYPDGLHTQAHRSPAFMARNLPRDALPIDSNGLGGSDHGTVIFWAKRDYALGNPSRSGCFSCIRYGATLPADGVNAPTHAIIIGSQGAGMRDWGVLIENKLSDPDQDSALPGNPKYERFYTALIPYQYPMDRRWRLVSAFFDTDEIPPDDGEAYVRGRFFGGPVRRSWATWYNPKMEPSVREKLVASPDMVFVLGSQVCQPVRTFALTHNLILDEVAIADFWDIGSTARPQSDLWAADVYVDGRYCKDGDGSPTDPRFVSTNLVQESGGDEVRVLAAWWTEWLPTLARPEPYTNALGATTYYSGSVDPTLLGNDLSGKPRVRIDVDLVEADGTQVPGPGGIVPLGFLSQGRRIALVRRDLRYRVYPRVILASPLTDPLLETPFLDDITFAYQRLGGPLVLQLSCVTK